MSARAWDGLLGALAGVPALPDAACRGLAQEFDVTDPIDAEPAIRICRSHCPRSTYQACRSWAQSQPPNTLSGVVGGEIYEWVSHQSLRRKRKGSAA
jgi:hypothetical protein